MVINMKIYIIRHGQTDWNLKRRIQGSRDTRLNETGIRQARELREKIGKLNYKFSRIYSSKLERALMTAQILAKDMDVEYLPWEGLEEINLGKWEGMSWAQVQENYPEEYKQWLQKRRYAKAPNGESYQDMLERVLTALHKILAKEYENVAIITHSAVIMCLQCYLTGTSFQDMNKFKVDNAAILEFDSTLFALEYRSDESA